MSLVKSCLLLNKESESFVLPTCYGLNIRCAMGLVRLFKRTALLPGLRRHILPGLRRQLETSESPSVPELGTLPKVDPQPARFGATSLRAMHNKTARFEATLSETVGGGDVMSSSNPDAPTKPALIVRVNECPV